ncbi:MAG TPA: gfo/Idh/MocA family oxidoreductase, partial [Planctomycetaceae bacterium]|nr:gfo/Idh/MocA family oxidoreductase [Planctomycetaceae bacterium]
GNISYRLGKQVPFGEKPGYMGDDARVAASFEKLLENLEVAGVELDDSTYQVGPLLEFDAQRERFVDNDAANAMLTRAYREPFIVPEQV